MESVQRFSSAIEEFLNEIGKAINQSYSQNELLRAKILLDLASDVSQLREKVRAVMLDPARTSPVQKQCDSASPEKRKKSNLGHMKADEIMRSVRDCMLKLGIADTGFKNEDEHYRTFFGSTSDNLGTLREIARKSETYPMKLHTIATYKKGSKNRPKGFDTILKQLGIELSHEGARMRFVLKSR